MIGSGAYGQVILAYGYLFQRKIFDQFIKMNHQRSTDKRIITDSHIPHFFNQFLRAFKFIHLAKVFVADIDEAVFDFLDRLLLMDPYKCITIEDVLHSFFFKVQLVHQQFHDKAVIINEQASMSVTKNMKKMDYY
ncbi:unnamed protein product [Rotaria sordida]|uniref:Uncharacterized protein n=1 Tax=Rotaria sordida TaxID=392033 RepID=A0A819VY08_9BILA|nr:unnamed protein product [Rotaria sordida]